MHDLIIEGDLAAIKIAAQEDPHLVNQKNAAGLPPLFAAALYRNREALDWLLENSAEVDVFASGYLGKAEVAERRSSPNQRLHFRDEPSATLFASAGFANPKGIFSSAVSCRRPSKSCETGYNRR